ncbi:UNVERIFIED_CONTAM: hypothetical protein FKN15_011473 [Acipenser sinensis]
MAALVAGEVVKARTVPEAGEVGIARTVPDAGEVGIARTVTEAEEVGKAMAVPEAGEAGEVGTVTSVPEAADVATATAVPEAGEVGTAMAALEAEEVEAATAVREAGEVGTATAVPEVGEVGTATAAREAADMATARTVPEVGEVGTAMALSEAGKVGKARAVPEAEELVTLFEQYCWGAVILHVVWLCPLSLERSWSGLHDGQWHNVRFLAKENFAMLTIDGDEASAVRTNSPLYIKTGKKYYFGEWDCMVKGYCSCHSQLQSEEFKCAKVQLEITLVESHDKCRSFQGCMQLIHVDDQMADLHAVEQGKLGSFENVSIDMCAIIDRCMPNHCEHGGKCTQTWDSFRCSCEGTGYTGATCHNSIYEQSCEAYKHLGKTSDAYWIDPDGSGPLGPFKVHCNMTAECSSVRAKQKAKENQGWGGAGREARGQRELRQEVREEKRVEVAASTESWE